MHPVLQMMTEAARTAGRSGSLREGTLEEARLGYEMVAGAGGEPPELAAVTDHTIPGPGGVLTIRVYTPAVLGPHPVLVYFHGGGFTIGSLDSHDPVARQLCAQSEALVVSVGYRLAPEHPFPAAVDDAFAATEWIAANAADLGGDGSRLAVAGDSAGGNLAAVTTLLARDAGGPAICFQALVYPTIDARGGYASIQENGDGIFLSADTLAWFYEQYLTRPEDAEDWRASPILARDLSNLPRTLILTAEYDPLRDEGEAFGEALRSAGNDVTIRRHEGMTHVFFQLWGMLDEAKVAMADTAAAIRAALH